MREIRRFNKQMSGNYDGIGGAGAGGPSSKMEMSDGEGGRGCCGGCVLM